MRATLSLGHFTEAPPYCSANLRNFDWPEALLFDCDGVSGAKLQALRLFLGLLLDLGYGIARSLPLRDKLA